MEPYNYYSSHQKCAYCKSTIPSGQVCYVVGSRNVIVCSQQCARWWEVREAGKK
jgi:ribosomal protein L24E